MDKFAKSVLKKKLDCLIEEALQNHVFTACSVGYIANNGLDIAGDIYNYGFAGDGEDIKPVKEDTFFDLASLTKPLVCSLSLLALLEEGKVKKGDTLKMFFKKELREKAAIKISDILTHSSGLPAHRPYYQKLIKLPENERKERIIDYILDEKLIFRTNKDTVYSDLGFILLGKIIEIVSGEYLDDYWIRKIIDPLNLNEGIFFANKLKKGTEVYVPTGLCSWSTERLYGRVNDDNCRAMGGVAGHAGIFGSAKALLSLCESIILQYRGDIQHPAYSSVQLKRELTDKEKSWVFGFDTPTIGSSSSGKYFSELTVGHLGFTGTSFWIDLKQEIAIVFLTNRVFCRDSLTAIKRLRPVLHNTIMECIIK